MDVKMLVSWWGGSIYTLTKSFGDIPLPTPFFPSTTQCTMMTDKWKNTVSSISGLFDCTKLYVDHDCEYMLASFVNASCLFQKANINV